MKAGNPYRIVVEKLAYYAEARGGTEWFGHVIDTLAEALAISVSYQDATILDARWYLEAACQLTRDPESWSYYTMFSHSGQAAHEYGAIFARYVNALRKWRHDMGTAQPFSARAASIFAALDQAFGDATDFPLDNLCSKALFKPNGILLRMPQFKWCPDIVKKIVGLDVARQDETSPSQVVEEAFAPCVAPRLLKGFIKDVDFENQIIVFKGRGESLSLKKQLKFNKTPKNVLWDFLVKLLIAPGDGYVTLPEGRKQWRGIFRRTAPGNPSRTILDPTQDAMIIGYHIYADKQRGELGPARVILKPKGDIAAYRRDMEIYRNWLATK